MTQTHNDQDSLSMASHGINIHATEADEQLEDNDQHQVVPAADTDEVLTTFSFRKRKRGKSGPDATITPSAKSAITRAIEAAQQGAPRPVFYPCIGTTFDSFEEAKEFYNLYSWEVGFGIRESRSKKNGNNYTTRKDIICSCQGYSSNPKGASARSGCRAKIRLHRTNDHGWVITDFESQHNHPLSTSCGENKQWGSHGDIDPMTKKFIRQLRSNNVSIGRVCSIIGATNPDSGIHIRKEAIRNICSKIAQEDIKNDIEKTVALLKRLQSEDNQLEVRFNTTDDGVIQSMLWCTGKNIADYKIFGDVVTFDTTYRTNLYNMAFGMFIGINNHYQSIIFGGVLLCQERTEDFEWAFKLFSNIMEGRNPQTILTDQCQAMAAAIRSTFPGTRHRWCRWHVLRNAKKQIGPAYSKKSKFKKLFNQLITEETSPTAFEATWHHLIKEYNLEDNKFLQRAFENRGMWAKPYFMDIFCAGMTSTQRSESANHMLKRIIQRAAPMHVFVSKFRELQFDRNQEEDRQNHISKQISRPLRIGVPIETHAASIYTKEMNDRFSRELYESGAYTIHSKSSNQTKFTVVHNKAIGDPEATRYQVHVTGYTEITCSCGLYQHSGMPCRHSLKVLVHLDRTEIPMNNIHHRWTLQTTNKNQTSDAPSTWQELISKSTAAKRRLVAVRALAISESCLHLDDSALNETLRALENLMPQNHATQTTSTSATQTSAVQDDNFENVGVLCPPRPTRRGRPRNTNAKSWKKHTKLEKEKRRPSKKENASATNDIPDTVPGRTRKLSDLLQVTARQ